MLNIAGRSSGETTTCDTSYTSNGCAFYNFICNEPVDAASAFPTCFSGAAQSPINLDLSSGTVQDSDQITFVGYDDQLGETPKLRLKDFTLQLDFEDSDAVSLQSLQLPRRRRRRAKRDANMPYITGGALGEDT